MASADVMISFMRLSDAFVTEHLKGVKDPAIACALAFALCETAQRLFLTAGMRDTRQVAQLFYQRADMLAGINVAPDQHDTPPATGGR